MATRPTRVLIIEGDSDDDSLIASYLADAAGSEENMHLTHAPRLSTACHLLARQSFDVVLLDLALPQTSGLDAFLRVKAASPWAPIIVLTGARDEELAVRAVKLGAQDHFIKGSPDCLLLRRAIRYAIERKRLAAEIDDLLDADSAPKLVLDGKGIVRYANCAAEALLGRAPADLVDKPFGRPLPSDGAEVVISSAGARDKRILLRTSPIAWHGEPARLVSLTDASAGLEPRAARLEADGDAGVVEARNNFLGRISHELRNTLATMKTAAYCLKDDGTEKLTPRQAQMVEMISRNIDRQSRLVENILDLSRLRADRLKVRLRRTAPAEIVADLAAEYRVGRVPGRLQLAVEPDLPAVDCDPDLIAQVLRNLIDNAARFAREKIVLAAAKSGAGRISFSVTDDGAGIPADRLGALFTPFTRLEDAESAAAHKGTGLGLAICREIVESHRGSIRAENAAGSGARFSFELPVSRGLGRPALPSAPAGTLAAGKRS
jgi:signal transduction histidine kinase